MTSDEFISLAALGGCGFAGGAAVAGGAVALVDGQDSAADGADGGGVGRGRGTATGLDAPACLAAVAGGVVGGEGLTTDEAMLAVNMVVVRF